MNRITRGRLLGIGIAVWILVLGIVLQPHGSAPPPVTHGHPLNPPDRDLPTLEPLQR